MEKNTIAAYDFDGTITNCDTFVDFTIFSKGRFRALCAFILFFPVIAVTKMRLYPNWKAKQLIFSYLFRGVNISVFNQMCKNYYEKRHNRIIRKSAAESIKRHIQNKDTLAVISASFSNWVRLFAEELGIQYVICTEIETDANGLISGKFSTPNCYGNEKVTRLLQLFPERESYILISYGDSSGDKDLLNFSDKAFYKTF